MRKVWSRQHGVKARKERFNLLKALKRDKEDLKTLKETKKSLKTEEKTKGEKPEKAMKPSQNRRRSGDNNKQY